MSKQSRIIKYDGYMVIRCDCESTNEPHRLTRNQGKYVCPNCQTTYECQMVLNVTPQMKLYHGGAEYGR